MTGPISGEYFIKYRHPWWRSLSQFQELEKKGKSISKHTNDSLKRLAGDARKISVLSGGMPDTIKNKYKRDLIDNNRAYDYLYELDVAWHFFLKGCQIIWYEDGGSPRPEFLAECDSMSFNVECKRISLDFARRIRRKDFYSLADLILPTIGDLKLMGTIDIKINERLKGSDHNLKHISEGVLDIVRSGDNQCTHEFPFGIANIDLVKANNKTVNTAKEHHNLLLNKAHNSHAIILFNSLNKQPANPIKLLLRSAQADDVLR